MFFQPVYEWWQLHELSRHISMSLRTQLHWKTLRPRWVDFVYGCCKHQIMKQFKMKFALGRNHGSVIYHKMWTHSHSITIQVRISAHSKEDKRGQHSPSIQKFLTDNISSTFALGIAWIIRWNVSFNLSQISQILEFPLSFQRRFVSKVVQFGAPWQMWSWSQQRHCLYVYYYLRGRQL